MVNMSRSSFRNILTYIIFVVFGLASIYGLAAAFIPPDLPPPDAEPTNTIGVSRGGTGATTATNARTNLGLGSLATLNSPLAVGSGGTGLTSAGSSGNVLVSNGTSWVSSTAGGAPSGSVMTYAGFRLAFG